MQWGIYMFIDRFTLKPLNLNNMTEEELKHLVENGFSEMRPKIEDMSNILMDFYIKGFQTCWRVLTGKELDL